VSSNEPYNWDFLNASMHASIASDEVPVFPRVRIWTLVLTDASNALIIIIEQYRLPSHSIREELSGFSGFVLTEHTWLGILLNWRSISDVWSTRSGYRTGPSSSHI
jgi:hypothetical protein